MSQKKNSSQECSSLSFKRVASKFEGEITSAMLQSNVTV